MTTQNHRRNQKVDQAINSTHFKYYRLQGSQAAKFITPLSQLRMSVFFDFPYLYAGSLEYETRYLETYFASPESFVFLVEHEGQIVGAATAIKANQADEAVQQALLSRGLDLDRICYFGESILLSPYRGQGLGKLFFAEREAFASNTLKSTMTLFCSVQRPDSHPLKPAGYLPLSTFWKNQGYQEVDGLTCEFVWQDRDSNEESAKLMQFWSKQK